MSDVYLPIIRKSDSKYVVMEDKKEIELRGQITIYEKNEKGGYNTLGSLSQIRNYDQIFETDKYFVKNEDKHLLIGGNKTKRRQYRYRYSSKKRVASQRRGRGRGRQTRYSRRK